MAGLCNRPHGVVTMVLQIGAVTDVLVELEALAV